MSDDTTTTEPEDEGHTNGGTIDGPDPNSEVVGVDIVSGEGHDPEPPDPALDELEDAPPVAPPEDDAELE